jgi:glycosyltransferase involved in cell wall biosynthesis
MAAPRLDLEALERFCDATSRVSTVSPTVRCRVLGELPEGGDLALAEAALRRAPMVKHLTAGTPPIEAIGGAHVYVHAGGASEVDQGLLTALAVGRPLIVPDLPGPRDCVDEVVNGYRVPAGNAKALAEAMLSMLRRADLLASMGHASRLKAERQFDGTMVTGTLLATLGIDAAPAAAASAA